MSAPGAPIIDYDALTYRPFFVPALAFDGIVVPGPCIVSALYMTTTPTAVGYAYSFNDSVSSGGNVIWSGGALALAAGPNLMLRTQAGLWLTQTGGAGVFASWVIVAAQLDASFGN